jgi:hypothetical protein
MRVLVVEETSCAAGGQQLLTGWAPWPQLQTEQETFRPQVAPNPWFWSGASNVHRYVPSFQEPTPYIFAI